MDATARKLGKNQTNGNSQLIAPFPTALAELGLGIVWRPLDFISCDLALASFHYFEPILVDSGLLETDTLHAEM